MGCGRGSGGWVSGLLALGAGRRQIAQARPRRPWRIARIDCRLWPLQMIAVELARLWAPNDHGDPVGPRLSFVKPWHAACPGRTPKRAPGPVDATDDGTRHHWLGHPSFASLLFQNLPDGAAQHARLICTPYLRGSRPTTTRPARSGTSSVRVTKTNIDGMPAWTAPAQVIGVSPLRRISPTSIPGGLQPLGGGLDIGC